jgi:hypothetical protein
LRIEGAAFFMEICVMDEAVQNQKTYYLCIGKSKWNGEWICGIKIIRD